MLSKAKNIVIKEVKEKIPWEHRVSATDIPYTLSDFPKSAGPQDIVAEPKLDVE